MDISPYIVIPIATVIASQIVKFAYHTMSHELDFKQLLKIGGMPSTFVAALVATAVTALAVDGLSSSVAAATLVLAVFIFDIFVANSRLTTRVQRHVKTDEAKLPEHTSADMFFGAVVGLISAMILSVSFWKEDLDWFFDRPSDNELSTSFIIFGGVFVVGEILAYITKRNNNRKLPTSRKLRRMFRASFTTVAIIGILFTFAQRETLGMFDTRIWTYLVYMYFVAVSVWAWWTTYRNAKMHLTEEKEHFEKVKEKSKSKKKKKKASRRKRK